MDEYIANMPGKIPDTTTHPELPFAKSESRQRRKNSARDRRTKDIRDSGEIPLQGQHSGTDTLAPNTLGASKKEPRSSALWFRNNGRPLSNMQSSRRLSNTGATLTGDWNNDMSIEEVFASRESSDYCEGGIVHAALSGEANDENISQLFCRMFTISGNHGSKALLADFREATLPSNAFWVYRLPSTLEGLGLTLSYRVAFLVESINYELSFYETVFQNRGFSLKIFTDPEDARSWLGGQSLDERSSTPPA